MLQLLSCVFLLGDYDKTCQLEYMVTLQKPLNYERYECLLVLVCAGRRDAYTPAGLGRTEH